MGLIDQMIALSIGMAGSYVVNMKEWKERITKQWIESESFPRKKKKAVRKSLRLEWDIASYDPLGFRSLFK